MHFQAPLVEVFDHEGGHALAVGSGLEQESGVVGILGVRDAGLYTLLYYTSTVPAIYVTTT